MDFTPEPQHSQGYRPTSYHQQDHSQHTRHYYQSPSPRTFIHSQPPSPVSTSSFEHSRFRHNSSTGQLLPEVGQTRCYWALLSSDLRFLVLDPVLAYHLHEQASDILNTSLLDFVHPDEKESAKQDLGGVLNERTLHGSVTRVRFCRLSCVRRLLGYTTSEEAPPYPPTFPADRIAIDYNYMAIDIVLNWAAEGVVLCFLHAVVDIAPREDNDESLKTGWSNWCSTYGFDEQQAQSMFHCLSDCILPQMRYNEECKPDPSLRVLQILRNNMERSLVLSWPPENISIQTYNTVPDAHDLGRLAQHVEIGTLGGGTNGGDAKTSCTRRYKSYQKMPLATNDEGDVEVESIFVPHGTIIFACHKIDYIHPHQQSYNNGTLYQGNPSEEMVVDYMPPVSQRRTYSVAGSAYDLPYAEESSEHDHLSSYVEQWVEGQSQSCTPSSHDQWDRAQSHEQSPSPNPSTIGINAVAERATNALVNMTCGTDWNPKARLRSPTRVSEKACPISSAAHNPTRPIKEKLPRHSDCAPGSDRSRNLHPNTPRESYSGSGRSSGNPPVGVSRCTSCRATHSPEWRKGPSGKKDLCNACGLRYARNRAKKEGITTRKRKDKDKGPTKHASSTSLSAASEQYPSSVPTSFVTTDNASLGESPHLTRDSPSNLSDTSGAGLSNLSVSREVGSINGSFRHYSRSESPSFADGFMVSGVRDNSGLYKVPSDSRHVPVKCSSARFVQSTNEPNQFTAGRSGSQGVSTHLTYDNVERGSYETSSSRWGGMDNDCQALVNSREGLAQNGTMPLRQSSYPPNSRLAGRSSSLRPTTDI